MKVLMVFPHVNFFRSLSPVARELDARGHEVVVLHGSRALAQTDGQTVVRGTPETVARKGRKSAMFPTVFSRALR